MKSETRDRKYHDFVRHKAAQSVTEYALLVGFVALAAAALFVGVGSSINDIWSKAANYTTVDVLYATDRKAVGFSREAGYYGVERAEDNDALQYGICKVSIPRDHRMGELESPSVWRLEFREDPEKHVVLLSAAAEASDMFAKEVRNHVQHSSKKDAFVFIHGFNVTFEDAARRTAQIAYDLGFTGAPILYSWPSQGKLTFVGYTTDENTVEWTVPHLTSFLEMIATSSGAQSIHLIAHSMGGRVLMSALERVSPATRQRFSEIVLSAPDIDAAVFKRIAAQIQNPKSRMTLYASSKDEAMVFSKMINGYPRAGESGPNIVIMKGLDTVDATSVKTELIGHFYYADNQSVLSDMFYLFRDHKPPQERFGLRSVESTLGLYWAFKP